MRVVVAVCKVVVNLACDVSAVEVVVVFVAADDNVPGVVVSNANAAVFVVVVAAASVNEVAVVGVFKFYLKETKNIFAVFHHFLVFLYHFPLNFQICIVLPLEQICFQQNIVHHKNSPNLRAKS